MKMSGAFTAYIETNGAKKQVFDNMLLNDFFKLLSSQQNPISDAPTIAIGNGTRATTLVDNRLQYEMQRKAATLLSAPEAEITDGELVATYSVRAVFEYGQAKFPVSEVAVNFTGSLGSLKHSRALLPIPVSITSNEKLIVEYTLTLTAPAADVTGSITVAAQPEPTDHSYVGRFGALLPLQGYTNTSENVNADFTKPLIYGPSSSLGPVGEGVAPLGGVKVRGEFNATGKTLSITATGDHNVTGGIGIVEALGAKYQFTPPISKTSFFEFKMSLNRAFTR